ncbi:hypothetical protein FJ970_17790 [Mesorhizobium sp. B2-1-8]|uniref:hypothetical protein n=1 Tax=Mesorhizobium sp. B2-1-8 TaxID=2589967 RepID=UPI00112DD9EC|nr:hypothetical protein [Mesorhizobium sp. B2-1-8]UCI16987.1 hypothetical protein FJ970_17790 [Mesorhizobium sp. B2-1-8]
MKPGDKFDGRAVLTSHVRHQLGTKATRRFVRALPIFRVDPDTPDRFKKLLRELNQAKKRP